MKSGHNTSYRWQPQDAATSPNAHSSDKGWLSPGSQTSPPSAVSHCLLRDTQMQHETSLTNLPCKICFFWSTYNMFLFTGCEWHGASSQGHSDCLTRRSMSHGQGFAWAAYITQQVPSFWRKSLLWRTDTTCLFTLDGICWHFLCAKALISEQCRKGRYQDTKFLGTQRCRRPRLYGIGERGCLLALPVEAKHRGQHVMHLSPPSKVPLEINMSGRGLKCFPMGKRGEEDKLS